jgi:GTP pyrophosphokinase
MVEVRWSTETDLTHQVSVRLVSDDRPGILANVSICFQDLSINISEANCRVLGDGTAIHTFRFGIESLEKLETIVQRLKSLKGISRVERA